MGANEQVQPACGAGLGLPHSIQNLPVAEKKTVLCKACGAESIYDALQTSAVCPFCGSNQVMEAADRETMAPGGVVPFQVTDEKAASLFKGWIRQKWFPSPSGLGGSTIF